MSQDLSLVTTEDILNELCKRYTTVLVAMLSDDEPEMKVAASGSDYTIMGMCRTIDKNILNSVTRNKVDRNEIDL